MRALRRLFMVACLSCTPFLTVPRASASAVKDQQLIEWYWHAMQTQQREWFGAVNAVQPWALCVKSHESATAGLYRATDHGDGGIANTGAYQDDQWTWDYFARLSGRPDLIGIPAMDATWYDQENVNAVGHSVDPGAWAGDSCG